MGQQTQFPSFLLRKPSVALCSFFLKDMPLGHCSSVAKDLSNDSTGEMEIASVMQGYTVFKNDTVTAKTTSPYSDFPPNFPLRTCSTHQTHPLPSAV